MAELQHEADGFAQRIAALRTDKGTSVVIGIQGPQGAGKSTFCRTLSRVLRDAVRLSTASLSIDDLYLTRDDRLALANQVHPLFITRGVPATHDVQLGVDVLAMLTRPGTTAIPRFDKTRDDRAPESEWTQARGPCDVVLFEGLWIGLPPLDERALQAPINALEEREDPRGVWRRHANRALAESYPRLFAPCDLLLHIAVPDFECVKHWRSGAEHEMHATLLAQGADTSRLMGEADLARFFDHYERFTKHAMQVMPQVADVVLQLDEQRRVVA